MVSHVLDLMAKVSDRQSLQSISFHSSVRKIYIQIHRLAFWILNAQNILEYKKPLCRTKIVNMDIIWSRLSNRLNCSLFSYK